MPRAFSELTFTPAVRAHQERMGSARTYAKFIAGGPRQGHLIGDPEKEFIQARDGFYQSTVSETGWPYVQYRGGPTGFLKVLGPQTIGYADFSGNKQYISRGNLDGNDRIAMILMDYANRRRLKILGRVVFTEGETAAATLYPEEAEAPAERAVVIRVEALDWNCPSHITPRFTEAELRPHLNRLGQQLAELQAENQRLKQQLAKSG
ncbi:MULTISPECIES: pyridoxamine 5'-phosphate oxidase family protein [unclassified Ruegeria]|uniref:pyridoxamine 5'-phosphate oxidase family protein n=1 Tax=unclassified Ruegeria TaxID=2625375 RepID=UPI0014931BC2|nr:MULTISPECIES: pyridoxamine 5'-phosphate oxidase family protein [unclassified Ruegeria]NOC43836.1 pyridoxamine 5'-phosphate oxidase family protein [Ruegeria sp. HKCCD7559]NOD84090.1 pyridoxamine 5'-phosphate oxidase family protein [Ruegeria sp. HKCCD6119]